MTVWLSPLCTSATPLFKSMRSIIFNLWCYISVATCHSSPTYPVLRNIGWYFSDGILLNVQALHITIALIRIDLQIRSLCCLCCAYCTLKWKHASSSVNPTYPVVLGVSLQHVDAWLPGSNASIKRVLVFATTFSNLRLSTAPCMDTCMHSC